MTVTTQKLARAAGVAAVLAGLLFILIQPVHPTEELATVAGTAWAITGSMTMAFAILALIGISGMYLTHVTQTGVLGLVGYLVFSAFLLLTVAYNVVEVLVLPPLVELAPAFVDSWNGIVTGDPGPVELPALEATWTLAFALYFVGSTLFGIALYRAPVRPRWAPSLLVLAALSTLTVPLLPHALERYAAVPMGVALIALGYSLWSDQQASETRLRSAAPSHAADLAPAD